MILTSGEQMVWAAEYVRSREVRLEKLTAKERSDHDKDYERALYNATEDAWEAVFELREMRDRLRRTRMETAEGGDVMLRDILGDNTYKERKP